MRRLGCSRDGRSPAQAPYEGWEVGARGDPGYSARTQASNLGFLVGCLKTPTERKVGGEKRTASEEQTKRDQTAHASREGLILSARNQVGAN